MPHPPYPPGARERWRRGEQGRLWMAQVIFCEGGAHDPKVNSLFLADVNTGIIRWINADVERNVEAVDHLLGFGGGSHERGE